MWDVFVWGGKNGMGCYVQGDKNRIGCFVRGGKNSMGCFVFVGYFERGVKKWHGMFCPGMFCPAPIYKVSLHVCDYFILD